MKPSDLEQRLSQEAERTRQPEHPEASELYAKIRIRAHEILNQHASHVIGGDQFWVYRFAVTKRPLPRELWHHLMNFDPTKEIALVETYLGAIDMPHIRPGSSASVQLLTLVRTYTHDNPDEEHDLQLIVNEQLEYGDPVDGMEDFASTGIYADNHLIFDNPVEHYESLLAGLDAFDALDQK